MRQGKWGAMIARGGLEEGESGTSCAFLNTHSKRVTGADSADLGLKGVCTMQLAMPMALRSIRVFRKSLKPKELYRSWSLGRDHFVFHSMRDTTVQAVAMTITHRYTGK